MTVSEGMDPTEARTASAYVALLRELKSRSGLTFRQLEERAAARGEVLARSTLADTLRRDAVPRPEVVAALVRACGAAEDVPVWLAAAERIAAAPEPADGGTDGGRRHPDGERASGAGPLNDGTGEAPREGGSARRPWLTRRPGGPRPRLSRPGVLVALGAAVLLGAGALLSAALPAGDDGRPSDGTSGPDAGYSRVRPARAPGLCLSDGTVRAPGGEGKLLAVQRPCSGAVPPRVYLRRADGGLYQIGFHHPQHGNGCLTVVDGGAFEDTLEPWNDCGAGGASQWFRAERATGTDGWRLRSAADDGDCLGVRGGTDEEGAAVAMEPCAGRPGGDQVFLIGRG
ncbi:XRE family transcriptional regulator [Streptomyces sp. SID8352]|uniref:XRE family transcriptional regulator n=1 Tax=Streptomyces sp. SID8352 TaxID=2690338 RepID=UPI00136CA474|nr:XRE family transcriptional regulator [Streptomyces sp. SID8352]MYU25032.1 XRE family transcriptional regulator [Streptomyces sp. SID8352]